MDAERWKRIDALLDSVFQLEPNKREDFLDKVCAGDESLRKELTTLIAADERARNFLKDPALAEAKPDFVLSSGTLLSNRYEIVAPIGAGGMGEVFRALDRTLSREVAVKILPERVRFDEKALSRFKKEAKTLAALSHPNILSIYDSGTDGDVTYAVMELLHGETLRQKLVSSPLAWKKAMEIAIPIADGLSAAHKAGIIHRDLKPENIFVTSDQRIKILDFGLARRESQLPVEEATSPPTDTRQTAPNVIVGTVPYMSPEQIKGEPLDARTDIFSFGCMLYEMISGRRPFQGETSPELMSAILKNDPLPLANIPMELQQVISHCLEKRPEDRFQSARDLHFALKTILASSSASAHPVTQPAFPFGRLAVGIAMLLVAIAGWFYVYRNISHAPVHKSIAVLPFENLSGDKQEEYFSDGMTEDVITQLSKVAELKVISRTSVMPYKSTNKNLRQIAKELDVATVLEGSVRRSGNRLRIVSQLIDASTDEHIWAETYDRDMSDIFTIQSDVAQHIAEALKTKLSPVEKQRIDKKPTQNLEAYDLYLKGREHLNRFTKTDSELAIELLHGSVTLDPSFALGYAGLSEAYSLSVISGAPESVYDTAIQMSKKAIALDPNLPEGYESLGYAYHFKSWYSKAIEMEKKALALNPNYARAAGILGKVLFLSGRLDEGLIWVKKYQQLDPTSPLSSRYVADVNRLLGNITEAKKWYQHGIQLDPNYRECYMQLIMTQQLYGTYEDVKPLEQKLLNIAPDEPATFETLRVSALFSGNYGKAKEYDDQTPADWKDVISGYLLWKEGKTKEAEVLFSKIRTEHEKTVNQETEFFGWDYAGIFAIQGDKRSAYEYLNQALKSGFIEPAYLERNPIYQNLRNDPEFQRIVAGFKEKAAQMRKRAEEQKL